MSARTAAERRVDALAAEKRKLMAIPYPSVQQRARLFEVHQKLEKAWLAVHEMRDGRR